MKKRTILSIHRLPILLILLSFTCLLLAQEKRGKGKKGPRIKKPKIENTIKATIYADNWFVLYINGQLAAVDSIPFIPHNVIEVDLLPEYPMTIAVMARDNAHPDTGLEYDNSQIGDGGFILRFGDGTVTSQSWKAQSFSHGPIEGDQTNPRVKEKAIPENWFAIDFDDSDWPTATRYTEAEIKPKAPFFEHDFSDAEWIWTRNLQLDNTVIFRTQIISPPDGRAVVSDWPRGHIVPDPKIAPAAAKTNIDKKQL